MNSQLLGPDHDLSDDLDHSAICLYETLNFWQKTYKSNFGKRRLSRLFSKLFYFDNNFDFRLLQIK